MNRAAIGFVVTFWAVALAVVWMSQSSAGLLLLLIGAVAALGLTGIVYYVGRTLFR